MNVTVRPLDVSSDSELAQHNLLIESADADLLGGIEHYTVEQTRARLQPSPYWDVMHWIAVATDEGGDRVVGYGGLSIPLSENLAAVYVDLVVHPQERGRGVATALLAEALLPAIRDSGRTLVGGYGAIPADGDPDDPQLPVNRIAASVGVSRKNVAVCRVLDLPLDDSLIAALAAQAAEKLGDYRVIFFDDAVPEEHLPAYGALLRQLDLDDPDEEFENEAAEYTPDRIRLAEQRRREAGKRTLIAVAVAPDGTFAGNSVVEFHAGDGTTIGWQENTLVMPDHRGHRLGLALKVETHRRLAEAAPGLRSIVTWNSHVNPWMIAINEQLGYRVAHREVAYQGRLSL